MSIAATQSLDKTDPLVGAGLRSLGTGPFQAAPGTVAADLADHATNTTGVHGITDTAALVTITEADLSASVPSRRTLGAGAQQAASGGDIRIQSGGWLPVGAIAESFSRCGIRHEAQTYASGRMAFAAGVILPAGRTVTSVTFVTGAQAMVGGQNQWFAIVDQAGAVLAKTADGLTSAWLADSGKTLTLATPFTAAVTIGVYLGCLVKATVMPSLVGMTHASFGADAIAPFTAAVGEGALTGPGSLGPVSSIFTDTRNLYGYVS